jgi:hypothetical protein
MDEKLHNSAGTWSSIKAYLHSLDKSGLIDLIHGIYESDADIQHALAAKFIPSDSRINRIRRRIGNLVYPDPLGTLPIRAGDALKTIRKFYRVSEDPSATSDLLLDGIEAGTTQAADLGIEDGSYFNALGQMVRMLVTLQAELPRRDRRTIRTRLVRIYKTGKDVGWGHGEQLAEAVTALRRMCR